MPRGTGIFKTIPQTVLHYQLITDIVKDVL